MMPDACKAAEAASVLDISSPACSQKAVGAVIKDKEQLSSL
jgi:hypothetical protein